MLFLRILICVVFALLYLGAAVFSSADLLYNLSAPVTTVAMVVVGATILLLVVAAVVIQRSRLTYKTSGLFAVALLLLVVQVPLQNSAQSYVKADYASKWQRVLSGLRVTELDDESLLGAQRRAHRHTPGSDARERRRCGLHVLPLCGGAGRPRHVFSAPPRDPRSGVGSLPRWPELSAELRPGAHDPGLGPRPGPLLPEVSAGRSLPSDEKRPGRNPIRHQDGPGPCSRARPNRGPSRRRPGTPTT